MDMDNVVELIKRNNRFLLISHVSMDGDTLGSAAALWQVLKNMGKEVSWVGDNEISEPYDEFELFHQMQQLPYSESAVYDVAIAIDCSDELRLADQQGFTKAEHRLVIDHHVTNKGFGEVNYIKPYPATAVCIYEIIRALGQPVIKEIAEALYIGIITDTGRFAHRGTDGYTMQTIAELYNAQIDTTDINDRLYKRRSYKKTKLLGEALSSLKLYLNNQAAIIVLEKEAFMRSGAEDSDTEGIVDYAIEIKDVKVAAFIKNIGINEYKVSLRSKCNGCNVAGIAQKYQGGGHVAAAGCTIKAPIETVLEQLLKDMEEELAANRV